MYGLTISLGFMVIMLTVALFVICGRLRKESSYKSSVIGSLQHSVSKFRHDVVVLSLQNRKQSKRIAELIELCDKLQPDLAAQHDENINRRFKLEDIPYKKMIGALHGYDPKVHIIDRKHIENIRDVSRIGIVDGNIDVKYKDDWFKELKDGEPFYYYYTFGNCVMEGSKPMNYKIDSCIIPRRTREEAEKDKQLYDSQKQK